MRSILRDLEGVRAVEFGDGYSAVCPVSRSQRESLAMFGIKEPVSEYRTDLAIPNLARYARKPH